MPTPRTQNWRSSDADRSTMLACVPLRIALIAPILTVSTLSRLPWRVAILVVITGTLLRGTPAKAESLTFSTAPGGLAIAGSGTAFTATLGNMNGLGQGTVPAGLTAVPMSNGTLYYTPIDMKVGAIFGTDYVSAYVSTNTHPAALVGYGCPYPLSCSTSGNYAALSTASGSPTTIIASPGVANNTTVTIGVGFFLPDNDGASAYTGTSNVVLTFKVTNSTFAFLTQTVTLTLSTTVQTAVQMKLGQAPGGATLVTTGGSPDYTLNFGNVNGLGIGPAAGLTTTSVAGGYVYSTPYLLDTAFSGFTSTTATIKASVTTNFAHPTQLILQDATASSGPFTAIPITPATPRTLTTAAGDRSTVTRYVGLFVSNANGPSTVTGADSATLTFTLTVP